MPFEQFTADELKAIINDFATCATSAGGEAEATIALLATRSLEAMISINRESEAYLRQSVEGHRFQYLLEQELARRQWGL